MRTSSNFRLRASPDKRRGLKCSDTQKARESLLERARAHQIAFSFIAIAVLGTGVFEHGSRAGRSLLAKKLHSQDTKYGLSHDHGSKMGKLVLRHLLRGMLLQRVCDVGIQIWLGRLRTCRLSSSRLRNRMLSIAL